MIQFRSITSPRNPMVKHARSLVFRKYRIKSGLFLADGVRTAREALESKTVERCFIDLERIDSLLSHEGIEQYLEKLPEERLIGIPSKIFRTLAPTDNPQGITCICRLPRYEIPAHELKGLSTQAPCVLILENIADPGNCGNIIRTAAALGIRQVAITGEGADPFGPKAVRASAGAVFGMNIWRIRQPGPLLEHLKALGRRILVADAHGDTPLPEFRFPLPFALILGGEAEGPSRESLGAADRAVSIPLTDEVESFNVATAAAIFLYAYRCQNPLA